MNRPIQLSVYSNSFVHLLFSELNAKASYADMCYNFRSSMAVFCHDFQSRLYVTRANKELL